MEPPIDTVRDHPGIDGSAFRQLHGVSETDLLVVSVSRLALDLKLDALVRAIDAVGLLAERYPLRLVLVGDGPAHGALLDRANALNARLGREVIRLHGSELDPRPAYAAADLVVGMGSSALRAMAIGRPVIVQGEHGFSEVFEPATLDLFLHQGFYGISDGVRGSQRLARQIETLVNDRSLRLRLRDFGRRIVTERFSLQRAIKLQLAIYEDVLRNPSGRKVGDALRSATRAFLVELDNHDPRRKRERHIWAATMLAAARTGSWPPQGLPRPAN
jgi:glycosyltransferase involved in cell wall biosynthesis